MQIGVIGWWGYDNQGDLAMLAALEHGFAPHRIVPIDIGFSSNPDAIDRLNGFDYLVIGGGTLIPGKLLSPFDTFNQWGIRLACPFGVLGLGVTLISEQYWSIVEALIERAEFFFVRDQTSHKLLRSHPKVQVAPDLTFAYPLDTCVSRFDGSLDRPPICGVHMRKVAGLDSLQWLKVISKLPVEVKGIPFSSFAVWEEHKLLRELDPECPSEFDPSRYCQVDLMIGTAFHSVLFAVQSATPVVAVNYAPKVENFMVDVGLERYLLPPNEPCRLPALINEMVKEYATIVHNLIEIREAMNEGAQQMLAMARTKIEQAGLRPNRSVGKVSIVVLGSEDDDIDQITLESCKNQTYEDLEIIYLTPVKNTLTHLVADDSRIMVVDVNPRAESGGILQRVLGQVSGEYVTWIRTGDWFTKDAINCMTKLLDQNKNLDVVYADFYVMTDERTLEGCHFVAEPRKLFRRNVVGPCFLMRKTVFTERGPLNTESPLPAYDLWLRLGSADLFHPFHTPLFYTTRDVDSEAVALRERVVRRKYRRDRPFWVQVFWRIVDTDCVENYLVQPLIHSVHLLRRLIRADGA
jgi:hypothetical protein